MALPQFAEQRLSLLTCCACGVEFAMPTAWEQSLRQSHASFYCPAGHSQFFSAKSPLEKAREEADLLRKRLEFANNARAAQEREVERQQRRVSAARGQTTRIKNRIAKGQCPCCGKAFADLAAHMESRHPDYAEGSKP